MKINWLLETKIKLKIEKTKTKLKIERNKTFQYIDLVFFAHFDL
jgi:hypothetical protein